MKQPLFIYGTLRDPKILKKAMGRLEKGIPAVAVGYKRGTIQFEKESYPFIRKNKNSTVRGKLLFVTSKELKRLDIWEAKFYKRKKVKVKGEKSAWAYVYEK